MQYETLRITWHSVSFSFEARILALARPWGQTFGLDSSIGSRPIYWSWLKVRLEYRDRAQHYEVRPRSRPIFLHRPWPWCWGVASAWSWCQIIWLNLSPVVGAIILASAKARMSRPKKDSSQYFGVSRGQNVETKDNITGPWPRYFGLGLGLRPILWHWPRPECWGKGWRQCYEAEDKVFYPNFGQVYNGCGCQCNMPFILTWMLFVDPMVKLLHQALKSHGC